MIISFMKALVLTWRKQRMFQFQDKKVTDQMMEKREKLL